MILQAGGLLPEASVEKIYIFKKNADGSEGQLVRVDGGKALFQNDSNNLVLEDRDFVVVYTKDQLQYRENAAFTRY